MLLCLGALPFRQRASFSGHHPRTPQETTVKSIKCICLFEQTHNRQVVVSSSCSQLIGGGINGSSLPQCGTQWQVLQKQLTLGK